MKSLELQEIDASLLRLIRLGVCQVVHGVTKEYLNPEEYTDEELLAIFDLPGTLFHSPQLH
jgi:hypothetical protein